MSSKELESFIVDHKQAVIEEIATQLNNLGSIFTSILETPHNKKGDIEIHKLLMAMGTSIGSMATLFNQFIILETGRLPEQEQERTIGFKAMIDKADRNNE